MLVSDADKNAELAAIIYQLAHKFSVYHYQYTRLIEYFLTDEWIHQIKSIRQYNFACEIANIYGSQIKQVLW